MKLLHSLIKQAAFSNMKNAQNLNKPELPVHNGGVKTLDKEFLKNFEQTKLQKVQKQVGKESRLIKSVSDFQTAVYQDPVLKMSLEGGLMNIPEGGILKGVTSAQLFQTLSNICLEPPKFEDNRINGLPIYCIFIDLLDNRFGQTFFGSKVVNQHLKEVFNDYNIMLCSQASLTYMNEDEPNGWFCKTAQNYVDYSHFFVDKSKPHWGFKSWNDWFTRAIRPQARPIDPRPNSIVHSSDSYPISFRPGQAGRNPCRNVKAEDAFWLKDNLYSLYDTLAARRMKITDLVDDHFVGGTVYQAYLSPWCYHRWHSPVSGTVVKSYKLDGTYYLSNPSFEPSPPNTQISNYMASIPIQSVVSTRQVFIIRLDDGSNRHIAVVQIGMGEVSSCKPFVSQGQKVQKGELLGQFEFGGSSYLLIFDKDFDLTFNPSISAINPVTKQTNKQLVNSWLATFK